MRSRRHRASITAMRSAPTSRSRPATPQIVVIQYANDGRPDFAANPTNGQPLPTYDAGAVAPLLGQPGGFDAWQAINYTGAGALPDARRCRSSSACRSTSTCRARSRPRSASSTRSARSTAFTADYVYSKGDHEKDVVDNINLTFDPATGRQPAVRRTARRGRIPDWGVVSMNTHLGRSAYHALQTAVARSGSAAAGRASATYTLSGLWNADTKPFSGLEQVPFATAPGSGRRVGSLGRRPAPSRGVQRHLAGRRRLPGERSCTIFAAGIRQAHTYGGDARGTGANFSRGRAASGRRRSFPRNDLHRADAEPHRPPVAAADSARRPRVDRWHRGDLQRVQPAELGHRHAGEHHRRSSCSTPTAQVRTAQFGFRLTF